MEDDKLNMFLNVSGEIEEEEGVGAVDLYMLPALVESWAGMDLSLSILDLQPLFQVQSCL